MDVSNWSMATQDLDDPTRPEGDASATNINISEETKETVAQEIFETSGYKGPRITIEDARAQVATASSDATRLKSTNQEDCPNCNPELEYHPTTHNLNRSCTCRLNMKRIKCEDCSFLVIPLPETTKPQGKCKSCILDYCVRCNDRDDERGFEQASNQTRTLCSDCQEDEDDKALQRQRRREWLDDFLEGVDMEDEEEGHRYRHYYVHYLKISQNQALIEAQETSRRSRNDCVGCFEFRVAKPGSCCEMCRYRVFQKYKTFVLNEKPNLEGGMEGLKQKLSSKNPKERKEAEKRQRCYKNLSELTATRKTNLIHQSLGKHRCVDCQYYKTIQKDDTCLKCIYDLFKAQETQRNNTGIPVSPNTAEKMLLAPPKRRSAEQAGTPPAATYSSKQADEVETLVPTETINTATYPSEQEAEVNTLVPTETGKSREDEIGEDKDWMAYRADHNLYATRGIGDKQYIQLRNELQRDEWNWYAPVDIHEARNIINALPINAADLKKIERCNWCGLDFVPRDEEAKAKKRCSNCKYRFVGNGTTLRYFCRTCDDQLVPLKDTECYQCEPQDCIALGIGVKNGHSRKTQKDQAREYVEKYNLKFPLPDVPQEILDKRDSSKPNERQNAAERYEALWNLTEEEAKQQADNWNQHADWNCGGCEENLDCTNGIEDDLQYIELCDLCIFKKFQKHKQKVLKSSGLTLACHVPVLAELLRRRCESTNPNIKKRAEAKFNKLWNQTAEEAAAEARKENDIGNVDCQGCVGLNKVYHDDEMGQEHLCHECIHKQFVEEKHRQESHQATAEAEDPSAGASATKSPPAPSSIPVADQSPPAPNQSEDTSSAKARSPPAPVQAGKRKTAARESGYFKAPTYRYQGPKAGTETIMESIDDAFEPTEDNNDDDMPGLIQRRFGEDDDDSDDDDDDDGEGEANEYDSYPPDYSVDNGLESNPQASDTEEGQHYNRHLDSDWRSRIRQQYKEDLRKASPQASDAEEDRVPLARDSQPVDPLAMISQHMQQLEEGFVREALTRSAQQAPGSPLTVNWRKRGVDPTINLSECQEYDSYSGCMKDKSQVDPNWRNRPKNLRERLNNNNYWHRRNALRHGEKDEDTVIHEHRMIKHHNSLRGEDRWDSRVFKTSDLKYYRYNKPYEQCDCDEPDEWGTYYDCQCDVNWHEHEDMKEDLNQTSYPYGRNLWPDGYRTYFGPADETKLPPIGDDVNKEGINANSWRRHMTEWCCQRPVLLEDMDDNTFQKFLEYNRGTDLHPKGWCKRGRYMFLNLEGEGMGDNKLKMYVDHIIKNNLNVHYLALNGCRLTDEGILALVELLSCHEVELHRVECWVLPPGSKTWASNFDIRANYASLDTLRRLIGASATNPTMASWEYDYHRPNNGNHRLKQYATTRQGHGYPEEEFVSLEDNKLGKKYVSKLLVKDSPGFSIANLPHQLEPLRQMPWLAWQIMRHNQEHFLQHMETTAPNTSRPTKKPRMSTNIFTQETNMSGAPIASHRPSQNNATNNILSRSEYAKHRGPIHAHGTGYPKEQEQANEDK